MSTALKPCSILFHLLLLCMIHGNFAREVPKVAVVQNIETAYDSQETGVDHLRLYHAENDDVKCSGCQKTVIHNFHQHLHTHVHMDHMELSWNILFHIEDLKLGKKIPLYFPTKKLSESVRLIPKEEADSIPFSSTQLPKILNFFSFRRNSPQAEAIEETVNHCEFPPLKEETKFCATSLESMLEKLGQQFGEGGNFRVLTTTRIKNRTPRLQNYTILENPKEISVTKMFGCHLMPYPYAVYYCHGQKRDTRLFIISVEGQEDGLRLEAVSICHMDTSHWDPEHASFRMLGIEPGTPVCHVFPEDNLIWFSSSSSVN